MPIHLLWGDDEAARQRAGEALVEQLLDPSWAAINLSRLEGQDTAQALRALEEARTPPFGSGARVVIVQRSPFCNQCPAELAEALEANVGLIAENCHLILINPAKPDARLRTTKTLQKLAKAGQATEQGFSLPAVWDGAGQVDLVVRTAKGLALSLEPAAAQALASAIGSDSARLASELEKLALFVGPGQAIGAAAVEALVGGQSTSSLAVGDALLASRPADAIALVDALLGAGEPALRIVASLSSQIRGWLWVALMEQAGEHDAGVIAKAAGIGNPKRIYVMRKQIRGKGPGLMLRLLGELLEVEAALKRGTDAAEAFRDGFLLSGAA